MFFFPKFLLKISLLLFSIKPNSCNLGTISSLFMGIGRRLTASKCVGSYRGYAAGSAGGSRGGVLNLYSEGWHSKFRVAAVLTASASCFPSCVKFGWLLHAAIISKPANTISLLLTISMISLSLFGLCYSGLTLNQDKATKPQTIQIVQQGEATPYWFKVNPLYNQLWAFFQVLYR